MPFLTFQHFLLVLCISVHVQARESQFFSKFTAKDANTDAAATQVGTTKEQAGQDPPAFLAESRNGYGLYGQGTGQLASSEVATATSLIDEPYYNKERAYDGFYNKDTYANDEGVFRSSSNNNNNNNNNNYFSAEEQRFRNSDANSRGGNMYTTNVHKVQQQGMSDTRFLQNGKYYYNIDDEEKFDTDRYAAEPRSVELDSNQVWYQANDNGNNNYHADNFASENAKVMAGGYDPVKNQYMFRPTKNGDEFMP